MPPSDAVVVTAIAGGGGAGAIVDLMAAVAGLVVGLLLMLPGHVIGATGAGDVKLLAALGTLLGPRGIVVAFVYSALAGGILALIVARRRSVLRETIERTATLVRTAGGNVAAIEHGTVDNRFAYAPAIAFGAIAAALGW
jgi:prepilin peptidase CpaA